MGKGSFTSFVWDGLWLWLPDVTLRNSSRNRTFDPSSCRGLKNEEQEERKTVQIHTKISTVAEVSKKKKKKSCF